MISTPKQTRRTTAWYSYYAGYSPQFVKDVLLNFGKTDGVVLDPWNGSGTTTHTASEQGYRSFGFDINPALTTIARARLTPIIVADSLAPIASEILLRAVHTITPVEDSDPLLAWFKIPAASEIRAISDACSAVLGQESRPSNAVSGAAPVPVLTAFFTCAVFLAVRGLIRRFGTSNPTWTRIPKGHQHKLNPGRKVIESHFLSATSILRDKLTIDADAPTANITTADSRRLPIAGHAASLVVTSPPYCTRIDYVRATMPELAVLNVTAQSTRDLREQTFGTTAVRSLTKRANESQVELGEYAKTLVASVAGHPSKGSERYYTPWIKQYVEDLQLSCGELHRVASPGAKACLVVQDSYYKEIHVDLQRLVSESLGASGWKFSDRFDFPVAITRSSMNPRALKHRTDRSANETLLVFGRI